MNDPQVQIIGGEKFTNPLSLKDREIMDAILKTGLVPVEPPPPGFWYFDKANVSPGDFVRACMKYDGFDYDRVENMIWRDETGKLRGHLNCFGLILQACIDCTLLPANFDINLSPARFGMKPARTLWKIIHDNGVEVPKEEMQAGDIVLFCYRDVDPKLNEPHHVAVCVLGGRYTILHGSELSGRSRIHQHIIHPHFDPLMWGRVEQVWRMRDYIYRDNEIL